MTNEWDLIRCDYLPPAFVLCELKFHKSKHGVEAELDQGEVPTERLEPFH